MGLKTLGYSQTMGVRPTPNPRIQALLECVQEVPKKISGGFKNRCFKFLVRNSISELLKTFPKIIPVFIKSDGDFLMGL